MSLKLIENPVNLAVSLDDVKDHLRLDVSTEDDLLTAYIRAATSFCEGYTHRALISQTWRLTLPDFQSAADASGIITIPRPPLQSISSITYVDGDGDTQAWVSYLVDTDSFLGSVRPVTSWPTVKADTPDAVKITFVAGYGDDAYDLPYAASQAIRFMVAHYHELRQPVLTGTIATAIPFAVESLLMQLMVAAVN